MIAYSINQELTQVLVSSLSAINTNQHRSYLVFIKDLPSRFPSKAKVAQLFYYVVFLFFKSPLFPSRQLIVMLDLMHYDISTQEQLALSKMPKTERNIEIQLRIFYDSTLVILYLHIIPG